MVGGVDLPADTVDRLRDALRAAGYGYDGGAALLGPTAHAALSQVVRAASLLSNCHIAILWGLN